MCRSWTWGRPDKLQAYADALYELRKAKGMTQEQAMATVKDPLYFGVMMVKLGDAEGMVAVLRTPRGRTASRAADHQGQKGHQHRFGHAFAMTGPGQTWGTTAR